MTTRLTREQAAIIGTFTGYLCGPLDDLWEYQDKLMGYSLMTHERAELWDVMRNAANADFMALVAVDDEGVQE